MMRSRTVVVGLVAAVGMLTSGCGLSFQSLPMGRTGPGSTYTVTAIFGSADRVDLGAEVRAGQAIVGRVYSMSTDGRQAFVELSLTDSVDLPVNVGASVRLPSALGSPYIQMDMPEEASKELLADGDTITRTELGPDIESTFAMLGNVVNGSGLDQLRTITTELDAAFGDRGESIRTMLSALDSTMALADENTEYFERTLAAVDSVTARLAQQQELIDNGIADSADLIGLLAAQQQDLRTLVSSTATAVSSMDTVMADHATIGVAVDDLAEIIAGIRDFNTTVGSVLVNVNDFITGFNSAVRGDYLLFDGAFDIPAAIDLLVTGGMPPGTETDTSSPSPDIASTLTDLLQGATR